MSGEGPQAFIDSNQLQAVWRPLSVPEHASAGKLLTAAGKRIRDEYREAFGTAIAETDPNAETVSIDLVKTAMMTAAYQGHTSYSRGEGARTKGGTLANPGGALTFTDWHREQLGIPIHALAEAYFDDCSDARY